MNFLKLLLFIIPAVVALTTADYDIKIWSRPGQYYAQFCQLQFIVISKYLSSNIEAFFLTPVKNFIFWDKQTYSYSDTQQIQTKFFKNIDTYDPCKTYETSMYRCVVLQKMFYPISSPRIKVYNSTHYSLEFRISNVVCPSSHENNQIQLEIKIANQTSSVPKLQANYKFQLTNLSYHGVDIIKLHPKKNYLINTQRSYRFSFAIFNSSFSGVWKQLQFRIKENNLIKLYSCSIDCDITQNSIVFTNPDFNSSSEKQLNFISYEIQSQSQKNHQFRIDFEFISTGTLNLQIAIISQYSSFYQSLKNGTIPNYYKNGYLGFAKDVIFGLSQDQYYNIPIQQRNDAINSTNSTQSTNSSSTSINIYVIRFISNSYFGFIFVLFMVLFGVIIFIIRKLVFFLECYVYIAWFFLVVALRGILLYFETQQIRSLLILFIAAQILQNLLNFLNYFFVFWFSKKLVRKFQNSSISLQFLKLLINYRFYGVMLAMFQFQYENRIFKNSYIYKVHILHLLISCIFVIAELTILVVIFSGWFSGLRLLYLVLLFVLYAQMVSFIKTLVNFLKKPIGKKNQKYEDTPETAKQIE